MRKGHFTHGKLQIGELLDLRRDAERRANQKAGVRAAASLDLPQRIGKLFGGKKPTLGRQHAEKAALGQLRADELRFLLQALGDLRGARILRQAAFRQLDELEGAVGLQPLGVFGGGAASV